MRARQLPLLPPMPREHGSDLRKGRRKTIRPLDPKKLVHIVLKSTQARGEKSLLSRRHKTAVDDLLVGSARKHHIRLKQRVNVGNHVHLLVTFTHRREFKAFIREIAGRIAMRVTGAGKTRELGTPFWDHRPYTRIVEWGKDLAGLARYFTKNLFESQGNGVAVARELALLHHGKPEIARALRPPE